ncbi:MAG: dihydrodipicolinate synthase family protein [Candidatus Latescibacter sp.]|nr:dihydrodipicolinate synthase family protein [Candidatus Latescibacter sp.]
MDDIRKKLTGVFAPVVTPFRNDELMLDDLRYNLRKLADSDLTGYLALGSNGEFRSLSDLEQLHVLEVFAEEKAGKVVMAGTACETTRFTIEKTRKAAEMGFEFASILTPGYFARQMNDAALIGHYEAIADASPIPILLYNAPGFTGGVQLTPRAVIQLSRHANICGMKDSSPTGPDRYLTILDHATDFHILAGSANFFYASLHLGAVGGIISLANPLPAPCCDLFRLFTEQKFDEALDLHFRLSRLNAAVSGTHGVAGVKAAMNVMGFRGGEPRLPLIPLTDSERDKVREAIIAEGFNIW